MRLRFRQHHQGRHARNAVTPGTRDKTGSGGELAARVGELEQRQRAIIAAMRAGSAGKPPEASARPDVTPETALAAGMRTAEPRAIVLDVGGGRQVIAVIGPEGTDPDALMRAAASLAEAS